MLALKAFHRLPKTGIGAISNIFGYLLKRNIFCLHQLIGDAHADCNKLLAKASSGILQNQSFGMTFGNMKLLGKVGNDAFGKMRDPRAGRLCRLRSRHGSDGGSKGDRFPRFAGVGASERDL